MPACHKSIVCRGERFSVPRRQRARKIIEGLGFFISTEQHTITYFDPI
jgi:hypothetical protein